MPRYIIIPILLVLFCGCEDNRPVVGPYPTEGLATWYNHRHTASGEKYRANQLTCAMRKSDFGKDYLVCNLENRKCAVVRHNDFGPSIGLFRKGRVIDLSRYAFSKIADLEQGVVPVRIVEVYSGQQD